MSDPVPESAERAFRAGLVGNGGLALGKLVVGWFAGSRALVADGWHSLADVVVNLAAWGVHRLAQRAPDEDHHFGHGKLEAFAGLTVGLLLVGGGLAVGVSAFTSEAELREGWGAWLALATACVSIAVNLVLAQLASVGAHEAKSDTLRALARDNASDALSSLLVVIGVLGSIMGLSWPETGATLGIGLVIVVMGWRSLADGFHVLMDRGDPELRGVIETTAGAVQGVRGVQSVRLHPVGGRVRVEIEISVDGTLTVVEGHEIAHSVEDAVTAAHPDVREVHVHVNPGSGVRDAEPTDTERDGSTG